MALDRPFTLSLSNQTLTLKDKSRTMRFVILCGFTLVFVATATSAPSQSADLGSSGDSGVAKSVKAKKLFVHEGYKTCVMEELKKFCANEDKNIKKCEKNYKKVFKERCMAACKDHFPKPNCNSNDDPMTN